MSKNTGAGSRAGRRIGTAFGPATNFAPDDLAAMNAWGDQFQGWVNSLTPAERDSINTYSGSDYRQINDALRGYGGAEVTPAIDALSKQIDAGIAKASMPEDTIVYRGMYKNPLGDSADPTGAIYIDKGYMSTSLNRATSENVFSGGANPVLFRIRVPKGHNAAYIRDVSKHRAEQEVLLGRNTRLRVRAVEHQQLVPGNPNSPVRTIYDVDIV